MQHTSPGPSDPRSDPKIQKRPVKTLHLVESQTGGVVQVHNLYEPQSPDGPVMRHEAVNAREARKGALRNAGKYVAGSSVNDDGGAQVTFVQKHVVECTLLSHIPSSSPHNHIKKKEQKDESFDSVPSLIETDFDSESKLLQ